AVCVAGRADETASWRQGSADPAGSRADHAAHHRQYHGSRATRGSRLRHDLSSGQAQTRGRAQAAAPAHLRNRVERSIRALCRADLERSARRGEPGNARRRGRKAPGGSAPVKSTALAKAKFYGPALGLVSVIGAIMMVEGLIRIGL